MVPRAQRLTVFFISLGLYLLALALPALQFKENIGAYGPQIVNHSGFALLFISLLGPLKVNFAFFANPCWLVGVLLLLNQKLRPAIVWLALALPFTLEIVQLRGQPFNEDEGGVVISYFQHPLIGWYVWIASILVPLAAAIYFRRTTFLSAEGSLQGRG